jgi:hypothetical protein
MNESTKQKDFDDRLKEVERRWLGTFNPLLTQLNDVERSDYYRRLRVATQLMEEYANFVKRKERYFLPWVGGEFNLALVIIGSIGILGFSLSFSDWFSGVLNFVESRSVFLTLIALTAALGWLHHAIEVETRRACNEIDVARYVFEWRSLGLSYALLHDSRSWASLDAREKRELSEAELRDHKVMRVKTRCEVCEALILDILSQRDIGATDYLLKKIRWTEFFDLMKADTP